MRKHLLYILLIVSTCFTMSCNKKQVQERPENLINRKTLVNLIAESYIIESYLQVAPDSINRFDLTAAYYKDLFNRYHVTREQFVSSMKYYLGDEDSAEKLLSEASAIISKKHKESATADSTALRQAEQANIPPDASENNPTP